MVLAGSLLRSPRSPTQSSVLLAGYVTPLTLFVPGFFITLSQGLSLSYAQAGAMATNPKLAGTAAGIGVFMQNFCGAAFAQLYGFLADGTVMPLTETTAITVLCATRRRRAAVRDGAAGAAGLEHDPEKWKPVFGNDHAQIR